MTNPIDVEKFRTWPMLEAWLNELILYYEGNAVRVDTTVDDNGSVAYSVPSEAAISTKVYSVAHTAEFAADSAEEAVNTAESGRSRSKRLPSEHVEGVARDIQDSDPPPGLDTFIHGRSDPIRPGEIVADLAGISSEDLDKIRENKLVEWLSDCLPCDGRVKAILRTDLTLPEIILEVADFMSDIEEILDMAIGAFDSSRFLASICSVLSLGKWCIPDLTALLGVLAAQLRQQWLVDPGLQFSWWGLVATLIYPILQAVYMLASMSLNVSLGPVKCLTTILKQTRDLIRSTENLDQTMGLSLGHLQETVLTTNIVQWKVSEETLNRIRGKVDWFQGDTLGDYSEILNLLSPVEVAILSVEDFRFRLNSLADWLSSRLSVLRSQSRETMLASLKTANVMFAVGRLYTFVSVLIRLAVEGGSICREENGKTIPEDNLERILNDTAVIQPWVEMETIMETQEEATQAGHKTPRDMFSIIDTSLGTKHKTLGCLGRISAAEEEKVRQWIKKLDKLEDQ